MSDIIIYLGFALAAYSVIGNDVIQTLGTFLSSNEKRPWWVLWAFAGSILAATLIYGWYVNNPTRAIRVDNYCEVKSDVPFKGQYLYYKELTNKKDSVPKYLTRPEEFDESKLSEKEFTFYLYERISKKNAVDEYEQKDSIVAKAIAPFVLSAVYQGKAYKVEFLSRPIRDVSYGRLDKYPLPSYFSWWYLFPPIVLLILTRIGIPVSTSFLILTFFNPKNLGQMAFKSGLGYLLAMLVGLIFYSIFAKMIEARFMKNELSGRKKNFWMTLQWCSTGFLWSQWLIQDFANIYVYLPRDISLLTLVITLIGMLALLAYIFYIQGGAIQGIVKSKTNTTDIRSATLIDFWFGLLLLYFKELNNVPMSTTWVFLGLLAGREYAIRWRFDGKVKANIHRLVLRDLGKATLGLVISVLLVYFIHIIKTGSFYMEFN